MAKTIKTFSQFINERHEQLEIFDEVKPEHVQIVDAFERFAEKLKFSGEFKSDKDYEKYIDENFDKAVTVMRNLGELDIVDYFGQFIYQNPAEDNKELYNKKWFKENECGMTYSDLSKTFNDDINPDEILSKKGLKEYEDFIPVQAKEIMNEHGFEDALKNVEDDGLPIYRSIIYKSVKDLYKQITEEYTGAGYFWSFTEEGAEPHSGYGNGQSEYILYGKVRLQDINWEQTLMKNIYSLREEKEIEVSADAVIKIENIKNAKADKFLNFEAPIYVES